MSEQLDSARDLPSILNAQRWAGGVRIVVQGAMRAPIRDGQVSLETSWRADVFYSPKQRKPSFSLVADTAPQLLQDLSALAAGELHMGQSDDY